MASHPMQAVIIGPQSGGDRWYDYTLDQDPETTPANDIVANLMHHLSETRDLPASNAHELNSAIRSGHHSLVMVIGSLYFSNEKMPFSAMIPW